MIEITCGILVSMGIYLLLEQHLLRKAFGIVVLSTAINIILLISGTLKNIMPAFIGKSSIGNFSNPLPQAMILTAIVIGFGLLAFLCTLIKIVGKDE